MPTTCLIIAHQSGEPWRPLAVENLDKLGTKVGIHGGEEGAGLYAMFNQGRYKY